MKYSLLISLIIFFNINFITAENKVYVNPTKDNLTIGVFEPVPKKVTPSRQYYENLLECGFNLGITEGSIEFFNQQFELLQGLPFYYLIYNSILYSNNNKEFLDAFKNAPNFSGWYLSDEPRFDRLENLKNVYNNLYLSNPQKLVYINLIGGLGKVFTGNFTNYNQYLDYIQKLFQPQLWSYDFYPISINQGKININYDTFYYNLECFRNISLKTKRPFWAFCQSMAFKSNWNQCPAPTEEYLKFEAYSALAYGAQGIIYWTYGLVSSNDSESYSSALVGLDGKKTKAWYYAKKVNNEIKKFNNIFYNCNVKEVKHTGNKIYKGTTKLEGIFGPFKEIKGSDPGLLVSRVENQGRSYVVIINRDVFNQQKVSLKLKENQKVIDITSSDKLIYNSSTEIPINLGKADWVIFQIVD